MSSPASVAQTIYCTYFDSGYLARGLSLIDSLRKQGDSSPVLVLALDAGVEQYFASENLPNISVINIKDLETFEPELLTAQTDRSQMEYYFTCTPLLIQYAQSLLASSNDVAIYLDADLFFFGSPTRVLEELSQGSVGIIEHRYSAKNEKKLAKYGKYNVGWVAFRNDEPGRNLLNWYGKSTLAWCSDKPSNGLYADQGYLNAFPEWPGTVTIKSLGANLAPWNVENYHLSTTQQGVVLVNNDPLLFFHFHGLKAQGNRYVTAEMLYGFRLTSELRANVYKPYIEVLTQNERKVQSVLGQQLKTKPRGNGLHGFVFRSYKWLMFVFAVLSGNSIKHEIR